MDGRGATLFISDLHLDESRPETINLALDLFSACSDVSALYILGDFFEYWIGDDYQSPAFTAVFSTLSKLAAQNTSVFVMHGNRDFLLSDRYLREYDVRLIPDDEVVVELYGARTLLLHGDTLCTDDTDYQKFRAQVRNLAWQREFLAKPLKARLQVVENLRLQSQKATAEKATDITDVNQKSVADALRRNDVKQMIHGHTHRPAVHKFTLDGIDYTRHVLGEWQSSAKIFVAAHSGIKMLEWPTQQLTPAT